MKLKDNIISILYIALLVVFFVLFFKVMTREIEIKEKQTASFIPSNVEPTGSDIRRFPKHWMDDIMYAEVIVDGHSYLLFKHGPTWDGTGGVVHKVNCEGEHLK